MKTEETIQSAPATSVQDAILDQIQGMHARAEHWLTDLQFYMEEIAFLQKLISQNFAQFFNHVAPGRAKTLTDDLESLQITGLEINTLIKGLLIDLKDQVVDPSAHDLQPVKIKIGELETRQANFLKTFRALKREVFTLTEKAMEAGSIKGLTRK